MSWPWWRAASCARHPVRERAPSADAGDGNGCVPAYQLAKVWQGRSAVKAASHGLAPTDESAVPPPTLERPALPPEPDRLPPTPPSRRTTPRLHRSSSKSLPTRQTHGSPGGTFAETHCGHGVRGVRTCHPRSRFRHDMQGGGHPGLPAGCWPALQGHPGLAAGCCLRGLATATR